ncbi:hypothetical protein Btru_077470 [Bulinus truncatus]|nr:hypothetical protein Btru_077470 [Bulinus truncatus]
MFFNKVGLYKKFISAQKNLKPISLLALKVKVQHEKTIVTLSETYKKIKVNKDAHTLPSAHASECCYSTSAKPQMTVSMQRWKKKKRKSKAQQKKEIEQLQQDLVKILTKRAIQLVKNKSLLDAQRQVVLTHAYTPLSSGMDHEHGLLSVISSDFGESFSKFVNKSEFIAHHVEAHLKSSQKIDREVSLLEGRQFPNNNQHVSSNECHSDLSISLDVDKPYVSPAPVSNGEQKQLGGVAMVNQLRHSSERSYVYSELFPGNIDRLKTLVPASDSTSFQTNLKNFLTELETFKDKSVISTLNWKEDSSHAKEAEESSSLIDNDNKGYDLKFSSPERPQFAGISNNSGSHSSAKHHNSSVNQQSSELIVTQNLLPSVFIPPSFITADDGQHSVNTLYDDHINDEADVVGEIQENVDLARIKNLQGAVDATKIGRTTITPSSIVSEVDRSKHKASNVKSKHKHSGAININVSNELQELIEKSFVDACCFSGNVLLAVRNVQYLSLRQKISSVNVFNKLIHTLAKKKDLKTLKNLFALMIKQGIAPTLQTYAGCLECFGRMANADIAQCEKLLSDAKNRGLDIAEIANACSFESDEFHFVLRAIKLVDPDFKPNPPNFEMKYCHELLNPLNEPNEKALEKNQYAIEISKSEMLSRASAQLKMEQGGEVVVASVYNSGKTDIKIRNLQKKVMDNWNKVLLQAFNARVTSLEKKAKDNGNMTLYPYLKLLPAEDYIKIIFNCLRELFSSTEGYSPAQSTIKNILGQAVNRKYNNAYKTSTNMDEKVLKLYDSYMDNYLDKDYTLDNHRCMWLKAMGQNFDTVNMDLSQKKWPSIIHKEIGNFLLEMILYDLKINANLLRTSLPQRMVPAFSTIFRPDVTMMSTSEIKLHPVVARLFKVDNIESFTFDPSIVPMLIPPVPWVSKNIGGLMLGSPSLIRMGFDMHHVDSLKNVKSTQFPAVLDSLNTLSACAWNINKPILDLQIEIFNSRGNSLLKISPPASDFPPLPTIKADMSVKDKAAIYRERMHLQQKKQDVHGLWCSDLYRLSIANKYRDEIFWFPHSLDFRGRTYPLPPHFNHLGSDNVRGMLLFAKGKPLGDKGYDWLKIHLVNLTGYKKRCSNQERLEFANSIMDLILDSADNPMTGEKWWQNADEPWQALACCMEIAKIERYEGRKEEYICHFPVHQDGSCNGLQHYAALGRDQAGAESVNLYPFDVPKDVYSDVVELVEKIRLKDAEEGNEIAKVLDGFVKRKVIKQTIMTTVYGVTRYGAKAQIHRQLKDLKEFPIDHAWPASIYLTHTTFSCLREMFTATKDIQDWLTESARHISALAPVDWVTPLGFPVLQPYYKKLSKAESKLDKFKPNTMKQKNAFPPNFIHSLDSTHMMLTSLYCMHAGTTFVSVHDCYWTHACDVPIMNKICREQFVNMHRQPLLEDLSEHLIEQVKKFYQLPHLQDELKDKSITSLLELLSNIPKRGTFDLDNVLKSTYFFS